MTIDLQLKSIVAYFALGMILYYTYYFTKQKNKKLIIYGTNIVITASFIYITYHLNSGRTHIYFIIALVIGTIFSKISVKYIKKLKNKLKSKNK